MNQLETFIRRLHKIGIETEYFGNYPFIYLDSINGKKVQGKYLGNHGFTAFFLTLKGGAEITDIGIIFNKIRETLCK